MFNHPIRVLQAIFLLLCLCISKAAYAVPVSDVMEIHVIPNVGGIPVRINLDNTYFDPIPVCTYNLPSSAASPAVVRINSISSNSMTVQLGVLDEEPGATATPGNVHCMIVEEGLHDINGTPIEARKVVSTNIIGRNTNPNWRDRNSGWENSLENITSLITHPFTDPIVLGQVMTSNDPLASIYYANDCSNNRASIPFSGNNEICVGKHISREFGTRADETIGVIIAGATTTTGASGSTGGFRAGTTPRSIAGVDDNPPYFQNTVETYSVGILSQSGEVGGDGAWAVLFGDNPLAGGRIAMAIEESLIDNNNRRHTTEVVNFLVVTVPTITLEKVVVGGGPNTAADFTLSFTGDANNSGVTGSANVTSFPVRPGTFTLSESTLAQYTQTDLSCTGGGSLNGNELQLTAFDFATCTFTNTFDPVAVAGFDITGNVFEDADTNGVRAVTEDWSNAPSVFVNIIDTQNPGVVLQSEQVNPGSGAYSFSEVPSGSYELIVTDSQINVSPVAPSEYIFISPSSGIEPLTVSTSNVSGRNFGLFLAPTLNLTKTTTTPTVVNTATGTSADYQIKLTNTASFGGDAQNVQISDVLPAGFTYNSGSAVFTTPATGNCLAAASRNSVVNPANGATGSITWGQWSVPAGCEVIIDFSVNISNTVADGNYDTSVSLTTATSPATVNNFDGAVSNVENVNVTSAVLTVAKESLIKTVEVGGVSNYRITVNNNGTATATGVDITDDLPAGFLYNSTISITGTHTRTSTIDPGQNSSSPRWRTFDIPAAGAVIIEFTSNIGGFVAEDFYQNSASATSTNAKTISNYDGDLAANNTDDVEVALSTPTANLSITNTDNLSSAIPGTAITYSIVVTNNGIDVLGASVTDTFDPNLFDVPNVTWTCAITSGSGACANPGTGDLAATIDLTAGSVATFDVIAPIRSDATGTISNTASVAPPTGTVDSNPGDNSALDDNTVLLPTGNLVITKDNGTNSVVAGINTTYTITVQNNGPSDLIGATVTDTFDPIDVNVPNVNWTCAIDGGSEGACGTIAGSGNISTTLDLTAGSSATLTAIVPVLETAVTPMVNNATITVPGTFTNSNGNNTANDTDVILSPQADLELTKITSNGAPGPGENFTYTLTLLNNGASGATNVVITDTFPGAGFNFVSAVAQQGAGANRTFTNNGSSLTWNVPFLPSGNSATLNITGRINASGIQTNTAEVTASDQGDPDSTPGNGVLTEDDMDSVDVNVGGAAVIADLKISKTDGLTSAVPGSTVTYTIVVENDASSLSNVVGATVEDIFDPTYFDVANVSWTCAITSGTGACGTPGPAAGNIVNTTTVDLNVGAAATFTVTAPTLSNATGTLLNTATVTAPTGVTESNPGNNSAVDNNTALTPQADLSLTNTVDIPNPNVGDTVTFTIEVTNAGPSDAANVTVRDILPSGYTFDFAGTSATQGSYNNATGDWTIGTLTTSAPVQTLSLAATVNSSGNYLNFAQVWTSDAPDGDSTPANNVVTEDDYDEDSIALLESDLSITKTADNLTPVPGNDVTFTLTVSNAGPTASAGVVIEDRLPTGFTFVSSSIVSSNGDEIATACTHVNSVVTCQLNSVDAGTDEVVELVARSNASTEGTTQTNVVEIISATVNDPDSTPGNNVLTEDDQDSIAIAVSAEDQANLSLTKVTSNPTPNTQELFNYTVEVSNAGPADATNVVIVDTLPAGLDFQSSVVTGGDGTENCSLVGQALSCSLGSIASASTERVIITVAAQSDQAGNTLTNSVEVTEVDNTDPNSVKNNGDTTEDDYAEVDVTINEPPGTFNISGNVFQDNGASATAHDGLVQGVEPPVGNATVQLLDDSGTVLDSVTTRGDGSYLFVVPLALILDPDCSYADAGVNNGFGFNPVTSTSCPPVDSAQFGVADFQVQVLPIADFLSISENLSTQSGAPGTVAAGPVTDGIVEFTYDAASLDNYVINFGHVRQSHWLKNQVADNGPDTVVFHSHQYKAFSDGTVTFTITDAVATPPNSSFSAILYQDFNCDGRLDASEPVINSNIGIDFDVNAEICVINRVSIPSNVSHDDTYRTTITASMTFTDPASTGHGVTASLELTDVTRAIALGQGVLVLAKFVENISEAGAPTTRNSALPDDVLRYTIDFSNNGTGPVTEVLVADSTPAFSTLEQPVQCPVSLPDGIVNCEVVSPSGAENFPGYQGPVQWQFDGSMVSGAAGTVTFEIRIE